jgi:threonine/homoserine/homoserine lactone efflux protein
MFAENIIAFAITTTALTMAPGLDTAMVLRSALANGGRHGALTAVGVAVGCLCWGSAAVLGLSALLQAWPLAFLALKWSGAAYLVWLGAQLLFRPRAVIVPGHVAASPSPRYGSSMLRGFSTNILNPKVGLFYVSFLPQFVPRAEVGSNYAFWLACSAAAIALVWFTLLASITAAIRPWLKNARVAKGLDRVTGGVFLILGFKLTQIANA